MDWWSIVKTDRREAYNTFLEEFGPGVELREIDAAEYPHLILRGGEAGTMNQPEFYLTLNNEGELDIAESPLRHGTPSRGADEFFVIGLFEEEYPQRYKEILDKFKEVLETHKDGGGPIDFHQILNLINDKLAEQGIFNDTDYATVHDETFPAILLQAFEETKLIDDYTITATTNAEKFNLFKETLEDFTYQFRELQFGVLRLDVPHEEERRARRRESRNRWRDLFNVIYDMFIDNIDGDVLFVPKKPISRTIMMPLFQIIEEEMNPSGE